MQIGYEWLKDETAPKIAAEAIKMIGTKETPGPGNNSVILGWASELGNRIVGIDYSKDSIPWCGLFVGVCAARAGYQPPRICVRASEWSNFGNDAMQQGGPMFGDIVILTRRGGGHVGIYVGESHDGKFLHLLGGNQGDEVNVRTFPRERMTAARRCPWRLNQPEQVRKIILVNTGRQSEREN